MSLYNIGFNLIAKPQMKSSSFVPASLSYYFLKFCAPQLCNKLNQRSLGRKKSNQSSDKDYRWRKGKQKERNRIEGAFGHVKAKYLLGKVRAKLPQTEYSWLRMALLSHNLVTAAKRA